MKVAQTKLLTVKVLIALFSTGFFLSLPAQEISKYDLEQRALKYYERQRYTKAVTDYEVLHQMYPKDAKYAYLLGKCYLKANMESQKSAELLKFAATRNYAKDTYYHLGIAYHRNYRFEDAALAFITFQKTAGTRELKKYDLEHWIATTSHAKQAVQLTRSLSVSQQADVKNAALESAFTDAKGGKYMYVPNEFRSNKDREQNYQALMFLPDNIAINDYVYFSSYGKNGKEGLQIYRAQRISERDYSLPEALPASINTRYDDAFPFFDKSTATLYFSSKGLNSMGAYDVFYAQLNPNTNTWSTPIKNDFPINSVHDDVLFTPLSNGSYGFLTNRNATPGHYTSYRIANTEFKYLTPSSYEEILAFASLSESAEAIPQTHLLASAPKATVPEVKVVNESTPSAKSTTQSEYSTKVQSAMQLQLQADSLESIVKSLRLKARDEHNYQKKQELVASITTLDKEAKRLQLLADAQYTDAETVRNSTPQQSGTPLTASTPAKVTDKGIRPIANKPARRKTTNYDAGYAAAQNAGQAIAQSFSINESSPYSSNNPIPEASTPMGLIYKIQLGAYSQNIAANTFGGLSPLSKEENASNTKYYVGNFQQIKEAREALNKVKEYGYPDAFLVSYYQQNKIPMQQAREIEFSKD